ncbi:MAG: hypothetical protein IKK95_06355, partial [Lachnospiraceae bacterium]|nr:hypothetical protein [Lachnospiraceae bacterium]
QQQWKRFEGLIGNNKNFNKNELCKQLPNTRYVVVERNNNQFLLYRQIEERHYILEEAESE